MLTEEFYNPFLESKSLYLKNFLNQLGQSDLFSICVKDIKTKKVCLCNAVCEKFWSLPDGVMHGMTARQILGRVSNFTNVEAELESIEKHERVTIEAGRSSVFQQALLSYDGFVAVRQSMIIPLKGISNRLIATAGIALDLTRYIHPSDLLALYLYYYPKRPETVARCCAHLKLNIYFHQPLSYEELRLLFTMVNDYRHKKIAESLEVTSKTVANYLSSIRDKLKTNVDIYTVLNTLSAKSKDRFNV